MRLTICRYLRVTNEKPKSLDNLVNIPKTTTICLTLVICMVCDYYPNKALYGVVCVCTWRQKEADLCKFRASLIYTERSMSARAT